MSSARLVRQRKEQGRGPRQDLRVEQPARRRQADVDRGAARDPVRRGEGPGDARDGPRLPLAGVRRRSRGLLAGGARDLRHAGGHRGGRAGRHVHQPAGRPGRAELPREQGALSRRGQLHRGRHGHHGARPSARLRGLPHRGVDPRSEGGLLHRRHRGRPRAQRRGVPRPRAALRADADGRARLGRLARRRSARHGGSHRHAGARATTPTSSPSTAIRCAT